MKKILMVLAALAVVSGTAISIYNQQGFHFNLKLRQQGTPDSDCYYEVFNVLAGGSCDSPFLNAHAREIETFLNWSGGVEGYLIGLCKQEQTPIHVTAKAEVQDGKTVFIYDGIVTENGKTKPYHQEFTLSWIVASYEEIYHIPVLQPVQSPPEAYQS